MNASLNKKLRSVKWGEFKLGELFDVLSYKKRFDANKVSLVKNGGHPYIVRQSTDNGKKGNIDESVLFLNHGNTISFGQDTATMFYQEVPYFTGDKIKILKPKYVEFGKKNAQFFLASMRKTFSSFAWGSSRFNVETLKEQLIMLPINNGKIDFDFMESFIAKLEAERVAELSAYLKVSGLDNYELSNKETAIIEKLKKKQIPFANFEFIEVFNNIKQGRRLKKDDQLPGSIPFVMSGTTNTGVVGCISNPVVEFPRNSITIDIFGNSFYRNYNFGAGDDTGVYWSTDNKYSKTSMLFFTTAMERALRGKYSYGKKLRSSQSLHFKMQLPSKDNKPDYDTMKTLISAVQKLVIKDVVIYADRKIEKTKEITKSEG